MANKFAEIFGDYFYFIFRVLIGFMFLCHGGEKLFGWFGAVPRHLQFVGGIEFITQPWMAGVFEFFFGGVFVILGMFTRFGAGAAAIEMTIAFFHFHVPLGFSMLPKGELSLLQHIKAFIPYFNKGEPALLYLSAFLVLIAFGARKWALDRVLEKNKLLKKII